MGVTEACFSDDETSHAQCIETYCDCGCHHDLIDDHFAGLHRSGFVPRCQECTKLERGDPNAVVSGDGEEP